MMKIQLGFKMLRKFSAFVSVITPILVCAQTPSSDQSCPPPPLPLERQMEYVRNAPAMNAGFLWRVEKDGRTSWLYGTMHFNHIDYTKPGSQIMISLRSSDVLALEINLQNQLTAPTSVPLPTIQLSDGQKDRLRKAYAKDCLAGNAVGMLAAGATSPLLITQAQRLGLFSGFSPDSRLAQIAQRSGKPIVSLETVEQQIAALAPSSQAEFDQSFEATLTHFESGKMQAELLQLYNSWRQNDWPAIVKLEQDMTANQPAFAERLLNERNLRMVEKIHALHQEGKRLFVAVGALHMAGTTALPKLLRDKGYDVRFVSLRN
jgi:uncharacterized protein